MTAQRVAAAVSFRAMGFPTVHEDELDGEGLELPIRFQRGEPGARPGIDLAELEGMPIPEVRVPITCIDYSDDRVETRHITDKDFEEFIKSRREPWVKVRWINVDGLNDPAGDPRAGDQVRLPSARDRRPDVDRPEAEARRLHRGRRTPAVPLPHRADDPARRQEARERADQHVRRASRSSSPSRRRPGDIWDPIRARIEKPGSRLREHDASYLAYTLLDAIVDHCFPVLEHYGDHLEELEDLVLDRPDRHTISDIHEVKRQLLLLRRAVWPMREVVNAMQREPHECMSDTTRTYLRDVYDHIIQIMDIIETYREVGTSLTETYMTSMSNRLSEVMKVLTIIGTIFIPLTFLAGVYGMNMPIPENHYAISYPIFWGVCIVLAGGMLKWFRKRGWL